MSVVSLIIIINITAKMYTILVCSIHVELWVNMLQHSLCQCAVWKLLQDKSYYWFNWLSRVLNVVGTRSWHRGEPVQGAWHGSLTWWVSTWWVHRSQCRTSPTDHSYVLCRHFTNGFHCIRLRLSVCPVRGGKPRRRRKLNIGQKLASTPWNRFKIARSKVNVTRYLVWT